MPCTQTGSLEGDRALAAQENATKLNQKNTQLTRILCSVFKAIDSLREVDRRFVLSLIGPEARDWRRRHKRLDREREQTLAKAAKRRQARL